MTGILLLDKPHIARTAGVCSQPICGTHPSMPVEDAAPEKVSKRLRAVMIDARLSTVDDLAEVAGANRSAASNWINAYNLIPVDKAVRLCEALRLNLDWLYRGVPDALPMATAIRLAAVQDQMEQGLASNPAPPKAAGRAGRASPGRKKAKASG